MKDFDTSEKLPLPWCWTKQSLGHQLEKEINRHHILYGQTFQTLGRRQDNDDVLFLVENNRFAVVHLTWRDQPHEDNYLPATQFFETWEDLYKNRILIDKTEFE
jgi:hypothetical protein